jgi:hypothetical protein
MAITGNLNRVINIPRVSVADKVMASQITDPLKLVHKDLLASREMNPDSMASQIMAADNNPAVLIASRAMNPDSMASQIMAADNNPVVLIANKATNPDSMASQIMAAVSNMVAIASKAMIPACMARVVMAADSTADSASREMNMDSQVMVEDNNTVATAAKVPTTAKDKPATTADNNIASRKPTNTLANAIAIHQEDTIKTGRINSVNTAVIRTDRILTASNKTIHMLMKEIKVSSQDMARDHSVLSMDNREDTNLLTVIPGTNGHGTVLTAVKKIPIGEEAAITVPTRVSEGIAVKTKTVTMISTKTTANPMTTLKDQEG